MSVATRQGLKQQAMFGEPIVVGDKQQCEAVTKAEATRSLDDATKTPVRREEDETKKLLITRESKSFTRLYALKCYNGWLKILDHSALIVSVWLDRKLGKTYNRTDDNGYGGVRAKYGVVSIPWRILS